MGEIPEVLLHLAFNLVGSVLEVMGEAWFPDFDWPDTTANRIILGVIIILLGVIIFWELR